MANAGKVFGFKIIDFLKQFYRRPQRQLIKQFKNVYVVSNPNIAQQQSVLQKFYASSQKVVYIVIETNKRFSLPKKTQNMDPPETVRGMTSLDRNIFKRTVQIPALRVPLKKVGVLKKGMKAVMMKMPGIKPIANLAEDDPDCKTHKLFLLSPEKYSSYEDLDADDKQTLTDNDVDASTFEMFTVNLTYENWSHPDIVRAVLPKDFDNVSGFSSIGHIAHLNLRPDAFPYKHLIGEVIIDKVPSVETVVNKLDVIDSTFRNFKMELLAGEDNFVTQTRENGCVYEFDFSKVYWNPRLGTEHARIINELKKGDIVYDMFAGVGPFAIPAGKRGIIVHANDLNPDSYSSLEKNIMLNKIASGIVKPYNLDAREFVRTILKPDLTKRLLSEESAIGQMHILMNLPASAIEFLDCFISLLCEVDLKEVGDSALPTVHCYCFSKSEDPCDDVQKQGERTLGRKFTSRNNVDVRYVRNVAPNKEMMCISFRLTTDILCAANMTEGEPEAKKMKTN